jgi:hypothetical protein
MSLPQTFKLFPPGKETHEKLLLGHAQMMLINSHAKDEVAGSHNVHNKNKKAAPLVASETVICPVSFRGGFFTCRFITYCRDLVPTRRPVAAATEETG